MPDSPIEWLWWLFSVVVVGLILGIVAPPLSRYLEGRYSSLQDRFLIRTAREKVEVDRLVGIMLEDAGVITVICARVQSVNTSVIMSLMGVTMSTLFLAIGTVALQVGNWLIMIYPNASAMIFTAIPSMRIVYMAFPMLGVFVFVFLVFLSLKSPNYRIRQAAILEYERRKEIKPTPKPGRIK